MKKSIFIAIGMALALFVYGYIASTAGHDHSKHSNEAEHSHSDHSH